MLKCEGRHDAANEGADLITEYLVNSGKRWLPDAVPAK
jgi:hypothetical protein